MDAGFNITHLDWLHLWLVCSRWNVLCVVLRVSCQIEKKNIFNKGVAVVGPQVAIGQTIYSWTSSGYKIIKTWRELSCNVNVQ